MTFTVRFPGTAYAPVTLPEGCNLSDQLSIIDSPLLFGCRTGICGTCLVEVEKIEVGDGITQLSEADTAEREALEVYAPGNANARLACRISLDVDIALRKIACA